MTESKNKTNYKGYISGLKGFACIMVMVGHYLGLFKYAESFPCDSQILSLYMRLNDSKIGFIVDETFWVILFFVVSGYLVAMSNITDIKTLAKKSTMRFLRLGVPVLAACFIIYLISMTLGFNNNATVELFECSFLQKPYGSPITLWSIIKSPIDVLLLGDVALNGPYWVLREMFVTSLVIYLLSYLKNLIKNKNIYLILLSLVFVASMFFSNVVFAGIFGMIIALLEKDKKLLSNTVFVFMTVVFCASLYFIPRNRISCIFFGTLIVLLPKLSLLKTVFSSKIALFINKISFGIYSLHWPIFLSAGMFILVKLNSSVGLFVSSIISIFASIVITIVLSILYYYFAEKYIYIGLKKLENFGRKVK